MRRMTSRVLACLVLLSALVAPAAAAQSISDRSPRLAGNVALGFAGELDSHARSRLGTLRSEVDLEPSIGFDARGELPVLDFVAIGGWFEFLSVENDASGSEREETFSFDAFVRLRWVFEVIARTLYIEPYVLLPIGFTMAVLPNASGSGDEVWPGWNTAVLPGVQVLHESGFGGYFELGWRHAEVYQERSVLGTSTDISLILNELALNLGFVYAL